MNDHKTGLTVLICTHNRVELLERVIASLNAADRPTLPVRILVAANACSDDTVARMQAYRATAPSRGGIELDVLVVPTPGKSHALNAAIPLIQTELIAFVDDDHRVEATYLVAIESAVETWPDAGLYCGRIIPDWDGSEPSWVHDEGPYRIYPLPVPRYDQGDAPKTITAEVGPIPGGGNLVMRRSVFDLCGRFSTDLGPQGHDLGGGEDSEYVLRAMARGVRCQYQPCMVQYHFVDTSRLTLSYLMRKGFQRTRSTSRIQGNGVVPLYMWRKVAEYSLQSTLCLSWAKRRFFLVRTAAALGELQGRRESGHRGKQLDLPADGLTLALWMLGGSAALGLAAAWITAGPSHWLAFLPAVLIAALGTGALLWKSLSSFTRTGPQIREEILAHYRKYSIYALARLGLWSMLLMLYLAGAGVVIYGMAGIVFDWEWSRLAASISAALGLLGAAVLRFLCLLRFNPGLLVASMHYRTTRLHPVWRWASARRMAALLWMLASATLLLFAAALTSLAEEADTQALIAVCGSALFYTSSLAWALLQPEAPTFNYERDADSEMPPNIVMIGSDTLRVDRLGSLGYHRQLTPNIDALGKEGAVFSNCYVPCARTAPSLVSLLTGMWPHSHGIRDNFVADEETRLKVDTLPQILKAHGYCTASISDWCGADLGKFSFGFDLTDLPEDQWNLRYLLRQGPKDLRLFISAFTHNRLGRLFLPEIFYLGGVPQTSDMGRRSRRLLSRLADARQPFLLNVFYSTTHPPFASEWPWYERYADPNYDGTSRFAMAKLTDPFEIIKRQGEPREEFDLDQIIDLYDACVSQFDDEVGKMLRHLDACGLRENTIVVVYSDHGMEFFEHDTWGQGNSAVGDYSARVPLIIRAPSGLNTGVVEAVVRTIDIAPTLLEMTRSQIPVQMEGVSLASYLQSGQALPELSAYNETGLWLTSMPNSHPEHLRYPDLLELIEIPNKESGTLSIKKAYWDITISARDRMLREGNWKLVEQPLTHGSNLLLFDLLTDPLCKNNLVRQHPDIAEQMSLRLSSLSSSLANPEKGNSFAQLV